MAQTAIFMRGNLNRNSMVLVCSILPSSLVSQFNGTRVSHPSRCNSAGGEESRDLISAVGNEDTQAHK
jgi:hypothetical protein